MSEVFMEDPERMLEEEFVAQYLKSKGYTLETARKLPAEEFKKLMIEANTYAASKVAEVENRARIVHEIHGVSEE